MSTATHPRELLLLRHAKSEMDSELGTDLDRALTTQGRLDGTRVGTWLGGQGLAPDHVVSSPALRARQTTDLVLGVLGLGSDEVRWEERIYEAGLRTLLTVVAEIPTAALRVLLVGHNPGLEALLQHLDAQTAAAPVPVPAGTLAQVALPASWEDLQPGAGRLIGIVRPSELSD